MNNTLLFLILMVPGTFFLGLYDVFVRKFLREGVNEGLLLGTTFVCSGTVLSLISFFVGWPKITSGFLTAFLITITLNIFSQLIWYKAFKREEASLISPLRLLTPPLVLLSGFFVLKETPSLWGVVGVLTTIFGLWFLVQSEATFKSVSFWDVIKKPGVILGLIGAVSFAVSFPFDKQAVLHSSALFFSGLAYVAVGLGNLLIAYFTNRGKTVVVPNVSVFRKEMPLFVLVHVLGGFLTFQALTYSLAAYAASAKRLWSLWAVILSGKFLQEKNILKKLVATAIMVGGIAITTFLG